MVLLLGLLFIQERQKVFAELEVSGIKRHDLGQVRLCHTCKAAGQPEGVHGSD